MVTKLAPIMIIAGVLIFWWHVQAQGAKLFAGIHVGMSRSEIRKLLGPPRRIQPETDGERWDYASLRLLDTRVKFDTNGLVSAFGKKWEHDDPDTNRRSQRHIAGWRWITYIRRQAPLHALNFMIYRAIWFIGMGFFFGSIFGRTAFSYWVTAIAAVAILVGIFGDILRRKKTTHSAPPQSVWSWNEDNRFFAL
jgi:hypothetical protein